MNYTTCTMICVHTPKEKVLDLVDLFTLKGEIVLLSCFNIINDASIEDASYIEMDQEKINISDKLVILGELSPTDDYANALVEYAKSIGKSIQFACC